MKERIKELIAYKGITAGELASSLEVQRSNISHILNGRNKPGASLIEKLLLIFPDINARWLLTGEGNMIEGMKIETVSNDSPAPAVEKQAIKNIPPDNIPNINSEKQIDKIVLLYSDGTFNSYKK